MTTYRIIPPTLVTALLLASYSTLPPTNAQLDQARSDYQAAQNDARAATLAGGEMKQAGEALAKANDAWTRREEPSEVDHLAYLARQRVAIARETVQQKTADQGVANAAASRDKLRLALRTNEADAVQQQAQAAQRKAEASQRDSEAALRQSESLRQAANSAQVRNGELEAQLADLNAKKTDRGMVITLGDVLFDTNQSRLKAGGVHSVEKLAGFLEQYPKRKALIEGFTDNVGSESSNQALSDRRAAAVRTALVDHGIGRERLATNGYGEAYPVSSNDSQGGRQLNRRVEIILSDDDGHLIPR